MQPGVLADYKVAAVLVLTVSFLLNVYSTERNSKSINNSTEKKEHSLDGRLLTTLNNMADIQYGNRVGMFPSPH